MWRQCIYIPLRIPLLETIMNGATKYLAASVLSLLCAAVASAQTPPTMKMTTPIPESILTPESVETRLGTLKFFDGFPDDETAKKVYDNLDFMRGVQAFL
jgi:hypothetical protein